MSSLRLASLLVLGLSACGGTHEVAEHVHEVIVETKADLDLSTQRELAWDHYRDGDYKAFVALMEQVAPKSQLDVDLYNLACGYALSGDKEKAIATLAIVADRGADYGMRDDSDLASLRGDPRFEALADKAALHEKASEYLEPYRDIAMTHYRNREYPQFTAMMEKIARWSANETDLYNLACGYALTGRPDEAIATLTLVADRGAHGQAASDEDFASLRGDPRFQALIARPAAN